MNTRIVISVLSLIAITLAAPVSWAGHDDAYQYSHQQLLDSSYRLSEQAEYFYGYAHKDSYSRTVRRAARALQLAADDLYYQIKQGGAEHQIQYAYQRTRRAYYVLRDCYAGPPAVLNKVGYALHDVEHDYQRYQRLLASYSDPYAGPRQGRHHRRDGKRVGIYYRNSPYGSELNLRLKVR